MRTHFSVAMCVYHGDDPVWLGQALDSVLNQTVQPDEVVLVVDGPVSGELDAMIRRYTSVKVVRFPENRGHGAARRSAMENCSHELVALMDADDICVPDRFERQLAAFSRQPELAAVGGQIREFSGSPEQIEGLRRVPLTDEAIRNDLKIRCPMNQVTVMLRKSQVLAAGGYLDWYGNEDYYLWIRMCRAGMGFANVPQVLVQVRVDQRTYHRRGGWRYFVSELRLQEYLLSCGLIGIPRFVANVAVRLAVQVLMPNGVRRWVYKTFARCRETQKGML